MVEFCVPNKIKDPLSTTKKLIVGLGNPGSEYEYTRHNLGYLTVKELARKHHASFQADKKVYGRVAKFQLGTLQVLCLLPTTYMNCSGKSVLHCLQYYQIAPSDMLIVCDDIAIPFESIRLRGKGSCGGHNGLRDIQASLGGQEYPRLRMGIGEPPPGNLEKYVLQRFSSEEKKLYLFLLRKELKQ